MSKFLKQKNKGSASRRQANASRGGFTLVETLVAISIFTVSILGLMSVLSSGISNISYVKQKIVATYLAQEGIEYIRNMRDTYVIFPSGAGWNAFNTKLAGASCAINGCYFNDQLLDYTKHTQQMVTVQTVFDCGDPNCSAHPLSYDSTTGKYGYASGTNSGFIRKINVIYDPTKPNQTTISSTVSWTQGSGNYHITFSEILYNWI